MEAPVVVTDTWVRTRWDNFVLLSDSPGYERAKSYYHHGWMRIEMSPVGPAHARDNGLLAQIIGAFSLTRGLRIKSYINPSLRKSGLAEAQPDLAFYIDQQPTPGRGTRPIDLATIPPPALAIEVSATTLADDLTTKRELYERMGVREYWVVDTINGRVTMFGRVEAAELVPIPNSAVLRGLLPAVLEEALRLGSSEGDTEAMQYILDLPQR